MAFLLISQTQTKNGAQDNSDQDSQNGPGPRPAAWIILEMPYEVVENEICCDFCVIFTENNLNKGYPKGRSWYSASRGMCPIQFRQIKFPET